MKKIMFTGHTSFTIAKQTSEILDNEKISDDYLFVTNYNFVPYTKKDVGDKIIYMAYDSETKVTDGTIWEEIRYLDKHTPHLILTVDKTSYKAYKRVGFKTHYIPMGYDDLNWKEVELKRDIPASFVGSIDDKRNSIFYLRYLFYKRYSNMFFSNRVKTPKKLNEIYSRSVIGLNDIILGINQRCFEIPINGACMAVNEQVREEINKDYPLKEGKHYVVWENIQDLDIIVKATKDKRDEAIAMGQKAKEVVLKYPYSKNVKEMIKRCHLKG